MMARVVVTGAAGFIGSHLVDALLARGAEVVGLDRRRPGEHAIADENLTAAIANPLCRDLSTEQLEDPVDGYDSVFHLAARPGARPPWGGEVIDYARANVLGAHRLLDACARPGVRRLVHASSSSVYAPANQRSHEADPTSSISPYTPAPELSPHQHPYANQPRASDWPLMVRPPKVRAVSPAPWG